MMLSYLKNTSKFCSQTEALQAAYIFNVQCILNIAIRDTHGWTISTNNVLSKDCLLIVVICYATLKSSVGNILVGVLAEDVSDDYNSLLNHVVDLGLDQVQQGADTALS